MKKRKEQKIKKQKNLILVILDSVILLLIIFSTLIEIIGYVRFTKEFTKEYNDSAYKTALTAKELINADNLNLYLETKGNTEEYILMKKKLQILADTQDISVIYVVKPDSDYKNYTSIINVLNKNSTYTPWEIGYRTKTTNKKYEKVYKNIYENDLQRAYIIRRRKLGEGLPHITALIPLKDSSGNIAGVLCVQRYMKGLSKVRRNYLFWISFTMFLLIIITIIAASKYIRKQIINPLNKVMNEAERFALENKKNNVLKENISNINEINSLASSIDKMETDIIKYINNLTQITKEKERIGTELHLASLIQEASLPNVFLSNDSFELYASMTPAKEVGGDFYDFFLIDENHLALVIADVSGKGIPAALFMMVTKILINENMLNIKNPSKVLERVNNRICEHNKANMFVTAWVGILDLQSGKLTFSNAGHEDVVIYKNKKSFSLDNNKHCLVLGAVENYKYTNCEINLSKGDKLFIYTDGVVEATNNNKEQFGFDNMLNSLNNASNLSPEKILKNVKKDIDKFIGDADQFDDLTMLSLEYKGGKK